MKKPTWVPPTLWSPLDSPFLPVPDAPARIFLVLVPGRHWFGRPCSGSLLEFPSATYCPCPETSLSSSGSHWFGHLDSCSGFPCSGPLSWIPPFLPSLVDHVISPVWTPLLLPVPGSCRLLQVGHVPAMRATTGKGGQ